MYAIYVEKIVTKCAEILLRNAQCYKMRRNFVTKCAEILLQNARVVTECAVVTQYPLTGNLASTSYRMQPWIYMQFYITLNHYKLAAYSSIQHIAYSSVQNLPDNKRILQSKTHKKQKVVPPIEQIPQKNIWEQASALSRDISVLNSKFSLLCAQSLTVSWPDFCPR